MATFAIADVLCAYATEPLRMNLQQLYATAEANNASIQSYNVKIQQAEEGIGVANSARLPEMDASASVSYLGNVKIWERPLKNAITAETPHFGNNVTLTASQVVYSGGAITSGIALARLEHEMTKVEADENRQKVRFGLTGYYLQLHSLHNQMEVLDNNINLTETLITLTKQRLEQGVALENDVTRNELQLENLRLGRVRVEDAMRIISHQLSTMLGMDTTVNIIPDDDFSNVLCPKDGEEAWQWLASERNIGMQKVAIGMKMARQKVRLERSELLPKVALVAEEHFDGPVTFEVPTLDRNINYWFVGVGVKYNISSLWKSSKRVRQARTAVLHNELQQRETADGVNDAIQAAYTNYLTSFTELSTRQKSVKLATQNYDVIQNRYTEGLALITDMVDAANVKLEAELALVNARINVIYNYYKLKYISNTL